ncbi:hypothetical protein F4782DRAFT_303072 [Xylaria castorea]|nr:hypothetical protein F4782DRAFT_303072 [Xylaria castorea]
MVAMLGGLNSGFFFLVMDVSHPTSRLQTLCNEAQATIVLGSCPKKIKQSTWHPERLSYPLPHCRFLQETRNIRFELVPLM